MKKVLVSVVVILAVVALSGCGVKEKSLKCTMENKTGEVVTTSIMSVNFKGNEAKDITLDLTISYTEKYASLADTFKKTLDSQKSTLEKTGYSVEVSSGDDFQKLVAKGTSETLDSSEYKGSYDATKESLEKQGYTCE